MYSRYSNRIEHIKRTFTRLSRGLLSEPKTKVRVSILFVVLCSLLNVSASGQSQGPNNSGNREAVPLPTLYRHFLAYQTHLDRAGAALDQRGEHGSELRDHFQRKLGFTDEEFAPVRTTALRLEAELADHDSKLKAAIDAARAQHPKTLRSPSELPPVPPELLQMQKERDTLIQNELDQLNRALGPNRAAKLQSLIQNDFAPNVTVQTVHPAPSHVPGGQPLPPFPQDGVR
jgi:hypothetical protein